MSFCFWGTDFGPFVFGRSIFKHCKTADLSFWVQQNKDFNILDEKQKIFGESDFWESGLRKIILSSRFGRVGIFYDRKNKKAPAFCAGVAALKFDYVPQNSRSEKNFFLSFFETQVVHEMANEGLSDTVEFRRFARKYIRRAKHAHCDSLFFLDAIFGEEKTKKILQHLAGTQIKIFTADDFLDNSFFVPSKQKIEIKSGDDLYFTTKRAEAILRIKLGMAVLKS